MAIYDENGVPVLKLSREDEDWVKSRHEKATRLLEKHSGAVVDADPGTTDQHDEGKQSANAAVQAQYDDLNKLLHLGDVVVIHNKAPRNAIFQQPDGSTIVDPGADDKTIVRLGGSTSDEALKECVAAFDLGHVHENDRVNRPDWVASTHEDLARILASHYNGGTADGPCKVRPLNEVL